MWLSSHSLCSGGVQCCWPRGHHHWKQDLQQLELAQCCHLCRHSHHDYRYVLVEMTANLFRSRIRQNVIEGCLGENIVIFYTLVFGDNRHVFFLLSLVFFCKQLNLCLHSHVIQDMETLPPKRQQVVYFASSMGSLGSHYV